MIDAIDWFWALALQPCLTGGQKWKDDYSRGRTANNLELRYRMGYNPTMVLYPI